MAKFRIGFGLPAVLTLLAGLGSAAAADPPPVSTMLAYKPHQSGIDITTPTEAEMAAWHRSQSEAGSAPATSLVRSVAAVSRPDLRERVLYAGVAAVALGAVSYGLWTSVQLSEHWAGFVHLVRQLVG